MINGISWVAKNLRILQRNSFYEHFRRHASAAFKTCGPNTVLTAVYCRLLPFTAVYRQLNADWTAVRTAVRTECNGNQTAQAPFWKPYFVCTYVSYVGPHTGSCRCWIFPRFVQTAGSHCFFLWARLSNWWHNVYIGRYTPPYLICT